MTKPISYTQVSTYTRCPFSYRLKYVDRLTVPTTSINRLWGSALHKAIETWHRIDRDGDLRQLIDAELARTVAPYDLDDCVLTMLELAHAHHELIAASDSTNPTATKPYKDWASSVKLAELRLRCADKANEHDGLQPYPTREDLWARIIKHPDIATRYIDFDCKLPLLYFNDGPAIELDITLETDLGPVRAIIDQLRANDEGLLPTDLKSNQSDPKPRDVQTNQQFIHYQMVVNAHPELPSTAGAIWYSLRTGNQLKQDQLRPAALTEWLETIADMLACHERGNFIRRRGSWCDTCDWYDTHCTPQQEGDNE